MIFLLLISTTDFEKATSYFSTSNPVFSQAYVLRVQTLFSPVETSFTALNFCSFYNKLFFPLLAFAEGYNVQITCCIYITPYAGHCTFFTAINYAYEELRQVDLSCYKIKQVPFPYFLALRFFNSVVVVRTFFFCTQLCKPQNFAFALSKSFGILSSLLSPYSPWQTSRLAFAFSQAYIFHV